MRSFYAVVAGAAAVLTLVLMTATAPRADAEPVDPELTSRPAVAERQGDVRSAPRPAELSFAGRLRGPGPRERISDNDLALLVAARRPTTLEQILAAGIPFRASQIDRLKDWGLLRQQGETFEATFPIILEAEVESLASLLDGIVPALANATVGSFRRLAQITAPGPESEVNAAALPAVATWILHGPVWARLASDPRTGLDALTADQMSRFPNRGWWGVVWYMRPRPTAPHELTVGRSDEWTVMLCWPRSDRPVDDAPVLSPTRAAQLAGSLRRDGREVRSPEDFPELRQLGLIGEDATLRVPVLEWDRRLPGEPEQDGEVTVAMFVDAVVETIVDTILRELPVEGVQELSGARERAAAYAITYPLLVERLLDAYGQWDPSLHLVSPGAQGQTGPALERGQTGTAGNGGTIAQPVPWLSAVVWRRLPTPTPTLELLW